MTFTDEQKSQLTELNLLQLAELAKFGADLTTGLVDALADDGKVGAWEGVQLGIKLSGAAVDAVQGISGVPAELKTVDAEDVETLGDVIFPSLGNLTDYHREFVSRSIGVAREIAHLAQLIRNKDVAKAKVVDEPEGAD